MDGFILVGKVETVRDYSFNNDKGELVEGVTVAISIQGATIATNGPITDNGYTPGEEVALKVRCYAAAKDGRGKLSVTRQGRLTDGDLDDLTSKVGE